MGVLRQIQRHFSCWCIALACMHDASLAGSHWLVPLLLYLPFVNEENECTLQNAFISSR